MKRPSRKQIKPWNKQRGMTLMELLVAGVISLIAASGMVIVMANTLGTGSKTIQMAKVTQEMRTAMQIMSRELRRANYHSTYMACFGNLGCLGTGSLDIAGKVGAINIIDNGDSDCFYFWYGRPGLTLASSPVAGFRRTTMNTASGLTVGVLEMTANSATGFDDAKCSPGYTSDWTAITDPELVDITAFNVSDADSVVEQINPAGDTQSVERIALTINAQLTPDASIPTWLRTGANPNAARELQEFISVRNHTTTAVASP